MKLAVFGGWVAIAVAAALLVLGVVSGEVPDTTADRVFGQPDFASFACNQGGSASSLTMCGPRSVAVAPNGRVYVADTANNRVLYWEFPREFDTLADGVIGQIDFYSTGCNDAGFVASFSLCQPVAVDTDGAGNLYVADRGNSRVLYYAGGEPNADAVFGQPNFTTGGCNTGGVSASSLCDPEGVSADDVTGNVYISDTGNSRVLGFYQPLTIDKVADRVFGQADYATAGCNSGGISATSLCAPQQLNFHGSQHLFVADTGNDRVVLYDNPLANSIGDIVIGQPSFAANGCNNGGLSASSLCAPMSVAIDENMNTYVADHGNRRVLRYDDPLMTDSTAEGVYGQASLTVDVCWDGGVSADSLCYPRGVAVSIYGDLFVAEDAGNRGMQYDACPGDRDCDGVLDGADNCPNVANPGQENFSREFIDNPPPLTQDDNTNPAADSVSDACDSDDDNDGRSDANEALGCPGPTGQFTPDSDGDGALDGVECLLGTDPNSSASRPTPAQCGNGLDGDLDGLSNRIEYCGSGTDDASADSDGDGNSDGCEAVSINMQAAINSGDQLILSQAVIADLTGPPTWNADLNKDGANNSGDQLLMAYVVKNHLC